MDDEKHVKSGGYVLDSLNDTTTLSYPQSVRKHRVRDLLRKQRRNRRSEMASQRVDVARCSAGFSLSLLSTKRSLLYHLHISFSLSLFRRRHAAGSKCEGVYLRGDAVLRRLEHNKQKKEIRRRKSTAYAYIDTHPPYIKDDFN